MHKNREATRPSENYLMDGLVLIDEFVVGGREKGKVGRSYNSNKKLHCITYNDSPSQIVD